MKKHLITMTALFVCTSISINTVAFGLTNTKSKEAFPLWEDRYSSILEEYKNAINNQLYPDSLPDNVSYVLDTTSLDNTGYTFIDLDNNGVYELITGNINTDDPYVYDVYTINDNNEIIQLKTSKLRSRVHISEQNRVLYNYLQQGIFHYQIYDLNGTELILDKELDSESADTATLITKDGEMVVREGDKLLNEFNNEYLIKTLELIPLSSSYAEEVKNMPAENNAESQDESESSKYDFSYTAVTPDEIYRNGDRYADVQELEIDGQNVYRLTFNTSITNGRQRPMGVSRTSFINDDYAYYVRDLGDGNYGVFRYDLNALDGEKLCEDRNIFDLMSVNGKYVFYLKDVDADGGTLVRYSLSTGKIKEIAKNVLNMKYGDKQYLIYGEAGDGWNVPIYISNRKGTDLIKVVDGVAAKIDDGKIVYIYRVDGANYEIHSCDCDGNNDETLKGFSAADFMSIVQEYDF